MLPLAPFVVLLLVLLSRGAVAQHVYNNVEEGWVLPDGRDSDFQQTFINGKTLAVAWEGWNSSTTDGSLGKGVTIGDLWVTSTSFAQAQYSQLLTKSVDISGPGSYSWTITIDAKTISSTAEFSLRFVGPGKNFNNIYVPVGNLPSPAFIILPGTTTSASPSPSPTPTPSSTIASTPVATSSAPSTVNSVPSSTSMTTSTTSQTSSSATSSTTTANLPSSTTSSSSPAPTSTLVVEAKAATTLKAGAIAGIGVGCALAGIAAVVLVVFACRRRRRTSASIDHEMKDRFIRFDSPAPPPPSELGPTERELGTFYNTTELPG